MNEFSKFYHMVSSVSDIVKYHNGETTRITRYHGIRNYTNKTTADFGIAAKSITHSSELSVAIEILKNVSSYRIRCTIEAYIYRFRLAWFAIRVASWRCCSAVPSAELGGT
jgi:hypothetical protein